MKIPAKTAILAGDLDLSNVITITSDKYAAEAAIISIWAKSEPGNEYNINKKSL